MSEDRRVAVIAGGVGAAKFLSGLLRFLPHELVTAVVNIADDFRIHGLAISPDLDTVTYTISSQVNSETGWGRSGESWRVMDELGKIGGHTWFSLGDLDLALHLYRTQRLAEGATLSVRPVLEISGISEVLQQRKESVVAISPIVGGAALKGPASRMLTELGYENSAVGVAVLYKDVAQTLVIDQIDAELSVRIEAEGMRAVITDTIMSDPERAAALAKSTLESVL